ncbi:MAG TPA: hypothetical protein VMF70_11250 [Gemmatimonadales bacterium]|nr:hypothetical protein [Gemmatimonadales bacterium]
MAGRRNAAAMRAVIALVALLAGCTETSLGYPGEWNVPVLATATDGLAFTVSANDFTFDQSYVCPARGDSVNVSLVVSSYAGGSALIEISDSSGVKLVQLPVTQNIVAAQGRSSVLGTPPFTVHLQFTRFHGLLVLGVGASAQ